MAFRSKLRSLTTYLHHRHHFSTTPLSTKQKSLATLSLIRTETNPQRILDICRAASLSPQLYNHRIAFSKAISKLRDSHCYNEIRSFLEESKSKKENLTEQNLSHFIVLYGQAGLLEDSIKTFEEFEKLGVRRGVVALNSLLFACMLAKDYGEMERVFIEFPKKYGVMPDLETYNTVIKGFCESGKADAGYLILGGMERKGVKANGKSFVLMIAGFYKEGKIEEVERVLEIMGERGVKPGILIYNGAIKSMCKLKKTKEARMLLDGVLSRGINLKPNCVTYGHLVLGFCREGNLEEAMRNFEEMKRRGLIPDSDCYYTLVCYLCEGKDFKGALKVCKECMEKKWFPQFSVMKSLVDGLVDISELNEARQIVGLFKRRFLRDADKWSEIEKGLPK